MKITDNLIFKNAILFKLNDYENSNDYTNLQSDLIITCKSRSCEYLRQWINNEDSNYEPKFNEIGSILDELCFRQIPAWMKLFNQSENKSDFINQTINELNN